MFERLKHIPFANSMLRRPPGFYGAARRHIADAEAMDSTARVNFQNKQIARVLQRARTLKGYAGQAQSQNLADWPLLTKAQMLGQENDFSTSALLPAIPALTGGTTGQPMKLMRSWKSAVFEQATIDYICSKFAIEPSSARIAVLRGDSIKFASDMTAPFWIDEGPQRRIFSAHHLNAETICHFKAALRSFQPDILFCYPSSLKNLLSLIGENATVKIPLVFASSEMLSEKTITRARNCLGANVIDFYGHAERIACAWSINGGGYRFLPAYGHIELLPAATAPGDSALLARVIATSLHPQGQIFVRYDTGDLVRVPSHDPAVLRKIALGILPFEAINGRDSEFVELVDGRRIIGLNHIPRGVTGASSVQIYHSAPQRVDLFIATRAELSHGSIAQLMTNFRQKFPASVEARLIFVDSPVREKNGKAPLLLRMPDPASICPTQIQPCFQMENVA